VLNLEEINEIKEHLRTREITGGFTV